MKMRVLMLLGRENILYVWAIVYISCMLSVIIFPGNKSFIYNLYITTFIVFIVMLPVYLWTGYLSDKVSISKIKNGYIIKEVKK